MLIGLIFWMPWLGMAIGAATGDKVLDAIEGTKATVLQTSLSKEAEAKLRDHFGADEIEG